MYSKPDPKQSDSKIQVFNTGLPGAGFGAEESRGLGGFGTGFKGLEV